MHVAADGAVAPVGDQMRDARPDRGDLLDELLDRLQRSHRPATVGAARQGHVGVFIDMVRDIAMNPGVTTRPSGPLLGTVGDLLESRRRNGAAWRAAARVCSSSFSWSC